jgi:hypothetical protein
LTVHVIYLIYFASPIYNNQVLVSSLPRKTYQLNTKHHGLPFMETRKRHRASAPSPQPPTFIQEVGEAPPTPAGASPLLGGRPRRVSFSSPETSSSSIRTVVSGHALDEVSWVSLVALMVILGVVAMAAGAWVASGHEQRLRDSSRSAYANAPQHEPVNNCPEEVSWVPGTGTTYTIIIIITAPCSSCSSYW